MYPNHMRFNSTSGDSSTQKGLPEMIFASSPEGLVSVGDLSAMRRFLLLSGDQAGQDRARISLLQAGTNSLTCTTGKRVVRMRLHGWPVSVLYRKGTQMPSTMGLASAKQPQVVYKLRELWGRAFGAAQGVLISPLSSCTHINSVLSINPVHLRDCVRHGGAMLAGKAPDQAWTFDQGSPRMEQASPELPAVFLFGAYVCWDFDGQEPSVSLTAGVKLEMQQLAQALFSFDADSVASVHVGSPVVYHEAITQGHGMQFAGMLSRSVTLGKEMSFTTRVLGDFMHLEVMYQDPGSEDDADFVIECSYSNVWRPSTHIAEIASMVAKEARVIQQSRQTLESSSVSLSFQPHSKFH